MREHRLAVATAAATFVLLVIGGLVHPTGSSLACPDWPLCNGQVFPAMRGGVLYEHGHRLAALTVAALTVALAAAVFRRRGERTLRRLALGAVGLVALQASLGALTVVFQLPLLVSASHLATSMAFFSLLLYLAHRLRPAGAPTAPTAPAAPRAVVGAATIAVYLQLVLGAFVRHTGSSLACNVDLVRCDGQLWPAFGPAQLHMAHRLWGYTVALLVLGAAWQAIRAGGPRVRLALASAAPALVLLQVGLGLLTVASYVALPVVSAHLAVGALLLANLVALWLALGPAGARIPAPPGREAGGLAHATGRA